MAERGVTAEPHDVAIIGAGFAGTILARVLRSQGMDVLLVEKDRHPRFALGESTTPLANLALERLAARYDLPDLHHLATYGRWTEHLPHLRRGLKRGFTFFRHRPDRPFRNTQANEARLMVAASPEDRLADTHWLRSDVDHHLVQSAFAEGVDYRDGTRLVDAEPDPDGVTLTLEPDDGPEYHTRAAFVVDAGGSGGVLARLFQIPPRVKPPRLDTGLLFAHFSGVRFLEDTVLNAHLGDGPYPESRAAVHHLLRNGWMYQLPFDHGVTSVGWVLRRDRTDIPFDVIQQDPAAAWREMLTVYPSLGALFAVAEPTTPIRFVPSLPYQHSRSAGPRWFLLPQAYAFFDPMFSIGMAWSLNAVERLAEVLVNGHDNWRSYGYLLNHEADQIRYLTEAAYLAMDDFERFTSVCLLYFATVSYSEIQQRLTDTQDRTPAWDGFLGARDPVVQSLLVQARDRLMHADESLEGFGDWVRRRIEPRDIAGLASPKIPNLFPVDLDLLVERSRLLGLEPEDMIAALPKLRGDADETGASSPGKES